MIVLHSSMQWEDDFDCTDGKCHAFIISMQEEDILEHIKDKCHLCTL